jgi:hypothetical protein
VVTGVGTVVRRLRQQVLSSWPAEDTWTLPALAAEGAIASVLGIVHSHILTGWPTPLIELLGPLGHEEIEGEAVRVVRERRRRRAAGQAAS